MFLNLDIPFKVVGDRISGLLGADPPPRWAKGRALTGEVTSTVGISTSSTLGVGTAFVDWVDGGVGAAARVVLVVLDEAASERPNEVLALELAVSM